jgi:hypothetical protein
MNVHVEDNVAYEQIVEIMRKLFRKQEMHVEDAIQQFYNRKQKSDENHYLYMLELISLAEKAFPDLNHNQIKKIVGRQLINGLANAFIKNQISIAIAIGVKILLRAFKAQTNMEIKAKK